MIIGSYQAYQPTKKEGIITTKLYYRRGALLGLGQCVKVTVNFIYLYIPVQFLQFNQRKKIVTLRKFHLYLSAPVFHGVLASYYKEQLKIKDSNCRDLTSETQALLLLREFILFF